MSASDRTGASVRQDSCSTPHLPIKWMEGLAFRKDNRETCAHSADEIRADPFAPSKLGFRCKVTAIHIAPQPTKGSIFKKNQLFSLVVPSYGTPIDYFCRKNLQCSNFQQFKTCSQNNKFVPLQTLVRVFHTLSQQKTILHNDIQTPWQLYELWSARWNCLGVLFLNYTFQ